MLNKGLGCRLVKFIYFWQHIYYDWSVFESQNSNTFLKQWLMVNQLLFQTAQNILPNKSGRLRIIVTLLKIMKNSNSCSIFDQLFFRVICSFQTWLSIIWHNQDSFITLKTRCTIIFTLAIPIELEFNSGYPWLVLSPLSQIP